MGRPFKPIMFVAQCKDAMYKVRSNAFIVSVLSVVTFIILGYFLFDKYFKEKKETIRQETRKTAKKELERELKKKEDEHVALYQSLKGEMKRKEDEHLATVGVLTQSMEAKTAAYKRLLDQFAKVKELNEELLGLRIVRTDENSSDDESSVDSCEESSFALDCTCETDLETDSEEKTQAIVQEENTQQAQPEEEPQQAQPEEEAQQAQPEEEPQQAAQPEEEPQQSQPEEETQEPQPEEEPQQPQQPQPEEEPQQSQPKKDAFGPSNGAADEDRPLWVNPILACLPPFPWGQ